MISFSRRISADLRGGGGEGGWDAARRGDLGDGTPMVGVSGLEEVISGFRGTVIGGRVVESGFR